MTEDVLDSSSRDQIKSLEKGLAVLRAFSEHQASWSMAAIAKQVGLSRPAVRRILLTLEKLGYAYQYHGQWGLTPRVLELGSGYFSKISLPEIAQPYLQQVVDKLQETCHVGVWDRLAVVHVARVEYPRVIPDSIYIGARLPAHATAIGQVLLSGLTEAEFSEYLESTERPQLTPMTLTGKAELRARLEQVRAQGFAITVQELVLGTTGAAAPITTSDGQTIGALGITSNPLRISLEDLEHHVAPSLMATASEIAKFYELSRRRRID